MIYLYEQKRVANTVFIVLVVILAGTVGYLALNQNDTVATPVPSSIPAPAPKNNTVSVSLGQQFTLKKGQVAKIIDAGLEIEIIEFFNSPCPAEVQCVWSGVGIEFEYRFNGQAQKYINLVQVFGYQIAIVKTDHETYANLVIEKMK